MSSIKISCVDCLTELKKLEGKFDTYAYCSDCFKFYGNLKDRERNVEECCNEPNKIFVKHQIRGGTYQLRMQCQNCGLMPVRSYKQEGKNIHDFPNANYGLQDEIALFRKQEREEKSIEIKRMYHMTFDSQIDYLDSKHDGYKLYLKTEEWRTKRKLVLERDNYNCQSCLNAKATEVHHLTYSHVFNEPLFDLVGICRPCHESITKMDRYQSDYNTIIHSKE